MHTFIHTRADAQMVPRLVQGRAIEDQHIEFKAFWGPWTPAEDKKSLDERRYEAVKDIAAMANALGGDIIVGVAEDRGRAAGYSLLPQMRDGRGQIVQWAAAYLTPHEVSRGLDVREYAIPVPDGERSVVVVSVPACTHGPVAVRLDRGGSPGAGGDPGQHRSFAMPRRVGSATQFLDLHEGAVVVHEEQRRLYLTALSLVPEQMIRVHLTATTFIQAPGQREWIRTAGGLDSGHGWLKRKDIGHALLTLTSGPHEGSNRVGGRDQWYQVGGGQSVAIPYTEIRDIWRDAGRKDMLNISLRGCMYWDGLSWHIADQPPTDAHFRGV